MIDLLIALAELAEAEGRALRRSAARLAGSMAFITVAALLALAGAGLMLWALYAWLQAELGVSAAGALTGAGALVLAGILTWAARRIVD